MPNPEKELTIEQLLKLRPQWEIYQRELNRARARLRGQIVVLLSRLAPLESATDPDIIAAAKDNVIAQVRILGDLFDYLTHIQSEAHQDKIAKKLHEAGQAFQPLDAPDPLPSGWEVML